MAKIKATKNGSKKDAIILKAAGLFKAKGFNAASMRDLADAVGVEAPSLYNHIGSKNELLNALCFNIADQFTAHLDVVEKKEATYARKIEHVIRFHIQMMLNKYDEVFVANHEWKHLQEPYLSNFLSQRRSYEKRLVSLLEHGIEKKEIKNIQPYVAVLTILSAVRGLEFLQRHKKNISALQLEDDMVGHLLNGIIK